MQMATIETVSQAEFLKSRQSLNAFSGYFEIAGRDAQVARQFSWGSTGEALADIPGLPFRLNGGELDYRTCISYLAGESPFLNIKECPLAGYALCQI
ncbi:hypothetical protein Ocin01_18074 [Orchesella cincta]|uniref:C-type lectin domain-containing protein n=1 Tax=Orchesella cincta TaxID=48709 RepID=A0A1D2M6K1_ORCCI|nr:hypothetical protein Ocin01_18074 [Orchesella cincta]